MSSITTVGSQYVPTTITTGGTAPNSSGITSLPTYNNSSSGTYYYTTTTNTVGIKQDYDLFKLPKRKMPEMVYVNGKLVTLGIFGSDVDCAYNGSDKLIFSPNILNWGVYVENKITISLIYKDEIYHYNTEYSSFGVQKEEGTKVVKVKLLSIVKREE